ncbi:hypothetical protein KP509_11G092100 [Ceratopteris richardii]|nr:hypothetical protein KP509_11G092100 [Ceratopteris richardii]
METPWNAHPVAISVPIHDSSGSALLGGPSIVVRISLSDLQQRQELERSIQLAAFQQFGSRKTGQIYAVTVPGFQGDVRAVRLRSGSFHRYGIKINEFTIPQGCYVEPVPERILLVYTKFSNSSLFQSVPAGYALASSVLSVLVYDGAELGTSEKPNNLTVSTSSALISIGFPQISGSECAYFSNNSTTVNISDTSQGVCQADHLGAFALVNRVLEPALPPAGLESSSNKHSNTWKIVLGSVVGGLILLLVIIIFAWGVGKRRNDAKISRMEYQAEQGETLQMATIRNSRVPTATNTRTQATLVNDYTV